MLRSFVFTATLGGQQPGAVVPRRPVPVVWDDLRPRTAARLAGVTARLAFAAAEAATARAAARWNGDGGSLGTQTVGGATGAGIALFVAIR